DIKTSDARPPICVASITLPRSPVSLSSADEVPHIFTRKSRLQPGEFLISSAKRPLQQYLHPAALAARLGPYLFDRLPESERAIGDRELGANRQPTPLQIEEHSPPRLRTLAHTVGEADKLLPALACGSDDDQQALRGVFETGLHVNAVDPEVDVAFGREIALAPARVLLGPGLLEASNARGRARAD